MTRKIGFLLIVIVYALLFRPVNAQTLQPNIQTARKMAVERDRNLFLVFTGSDWCPACVKLECEVLTSEEFMAYANDNLVLIKADFPSQKKNRQSDAQQEINNKRAEQYNPNGYFPLMVAISPKGQFLGH